MVEITLFIEGANPILNDEALTMSASSSFREAFSTLFDRALKNNYTSIKIQPLGSIKNSRNKLDETRDKNHESLFLLDLDCTKKKKTERLSNNYNPADCPRIFFMIQEMEAWILSQPDKIELFAKSKRLIRQKEGITISDAHNLKGKVIEDIVKPSQTLNRVLKDYFKTKSGDKSYSKSLDAPDLIELLDPEELYKTFDEFQMLIDKINNSQQ